ncbi:MAG: PLD nuclease N-terminal domain-containing protein [Tessaracoccus sp.]
MARVLLILAVVMLTIYCTVEVAQSRKYAVRAMPKWLWAVAVIAVPVIGPVCWLLAGRPVRETPPGGRAPDDDDDFLSGLR